MKEDVVQMAGTIIAPLAAGNFKVRLDAGADVLCRIAGRVVRYHIRITAGDRVRVEMSPYNLARGRIVYRL